ncbi:DedA family protein [Rudaeicoccus suwonensis]|uniref:Membrane-associated protein n=1 Tax=Rudaeicoccus suwonensis TaxID=657409 RepID=A0A561E789_9MICO|nr:VTT domain-containing protein [Rudaeicoccus suwonensis]TWE11486.1 membrane-associated protein [Rudaeicoccus suwonensis]
MHSLGPSFMDPQHLLNQFGGAFFFVSLLIVFIECGVLFPILPGDSLLFSIGLFSSSDKFHFHVPLWVSIPSLMIAAFAGNVTGYEIGRAVGTPIYERDGRILKKKYFEQTSAFFDKHGNKALVIGRFVPIVRTFITLVAGASRMDRRRFFTWSAVGAVLWVLIVTIAGMLLGKAFPGLADKIDIAMLVVVFLSVLPMLYEYVKHQREAKAIAAEVITAAEDITDHH